MQIILSLARFRDNYRFHFILLSHIGLRHIHEEVLLLYKYHLRSFDEFAHFEPSEYEKVVFSMSSLCLTLMYYGYESHDHVNGGTDFVIVRYLRVYSS
jgi:hypothetical protein